MYCVTMCTHTCIYVRMHKHIIYFLYGLYFWAMDGDLFVLIFIMKACIMYEYAYVRK